MKPTTCFPILFVLWWTVGVVVAQDYAERFDRLDRNSDSVLTAEETRNAEWFARLLPRLDRNGDGKLQKSEVNRSGNTSPSGQITFRESYIAGTRDSKGQFMGGTETMRLVAHDGKLFAANSYWTDQPDDDPQPGAQVLVKTGRDDPWSVDVNFHGVGRVSAMESIQFTRSVGGKKLLSPVQLLVADAAPTSNHRRPGRLACAVRNDATGEWEMSVIASSVNRGFIRAFGHHVDMVTGREFVVAGTGAGEIYVGQFDPSSTGQIRWNPEPEFSNPDFNGVAFRRCQGFCVANGKLYASVAPRLMERQDGENPTWREVFRWNPEERAGAGLRGITAVPSFDGTHEVILGSREQEGRILRIDPTRGDSVELELDSRSFLQNKLPGFRGGKLVAYNRFVPGRHPETDEPIHWVTVARGIRDERYAAWLMIRKQDASYEAIRVLDPDASVKQRLGTTRTLEYAPWNANEIYTGGYDGAGNQRRNHNTAWIYRAIIE